jgi:hypothetical protein
LQERLVAYPHHKVLHSARLYRLQILNEDDKTYERTTDEGKRFYKLSTIKLFTDITVAVS